MPTYRITSPDGRTFRVTGEGSKEDALAYIQAQYATPKQAEPEAQPTALSGSGLEDFRAGFGKAFVDIGRGIRQADVELSNKVGLGKWFPDRFGDQRVRQLRDEAAETRRRDAELIGSGAGFTGNVVGNVAAAVPALAIPGANTVSGASLVGAGMGALQPTQSAEERITNTGMGAALGGLGQWGGDKLVRSASNALASRASKAATQKAQNVVRDQTLTDAMHEGFVVPPQTTNPTAGNAILESISGKAATQQAASLKNQEVTNLLIRRDLGMADDAPLTVDALKKVRSDAGKVYEKVKGTGTIQADNQYYQELLDIIDDNSAIQKSFPGAAKTDDAVSELANSLAQPSFSADGAVEFAKRLRSDSKTNFRAAAVNGDQAKRQLAQAQWEAAGTLEDMIERHLQQQGQADLMGAFREARQLIAKSHSAEAALNEGTGNIQASKLVQQLRKGKPLSGGFEKIAKFASAAPKAMTEPTQSSGVSALSAMLAGGGAVGLGAPQLLALPAARWAARKAIMSKAGQRRLATPSYSPSRTGTLTLQGTRGLGRIAAPLSVAAYAAEQ